MGFEPAAYRGVVSRHLGAGGLLSPFKHAACKAQLAWLVVQGEEQGAMSISLPRVSSAELLLFPETAEGHVSKV